MRRRDSILRRLRAALEGDPRRFQIAYLGTFLAFVLTSRDFTLSAAQMTAIVAAALGTQALCTRVLRLPPAGAYSPLISGLSLCLLLRSNSLWVPALAAALAIASKFMLRARGKHWFNPSLFGLLAVLVATDDAWISPGMWGSRTVVAFFVAALGFTVVGRVGRADITVSFLAAHLGLKLARVLWLGDPMTIFVHQAVSGSLILFAFFMISDPRSTPDARSGRVVFAVAVAAVAHFLQFELFWNHAPLWALLFVSPATPLLDRVWPKPRFQWRDRGADHAISTPSNRVPVSLGRA